MSTEVIAQTKNYIKNLLQQDSTGHDWWHIHRVYNLAVHLAKKENANLFVVELAALLHDIADWKFNKGDDQLGVQLARQWLNELAVETSTIDHVCAIINDMPFKGAGTSSTMSTLEGMIVQDADRLDALGAIGIARTFAYGGYAGRPPHDPTIQPKLHTSFAEYKQHQGTTINHFHEKLFLLKNRMNTATAKAIAEKRHLLMENFVNEFLMEWDYFG